MRVAVLSYPMLFQTTGGLPMKIPRTVSALQARGIDAKLVDPVHDRLHDYDVVHVFAAINGNHRIVQMAKSFGKPVVLSTILGLPFSRFDRRRATLLTALTRRLSNWEITTSYQQIIDALEGADRLIALGKTEQGILVSGYGAAPEKICIVHNGIGQEFFSTEPEIFRRKYNVAEPFVLHAGEIGVVKNQLGLIRALKGTGISMILTGHVSASSESYLELCLREGGGQVRHLGELEHGVLMASAYAASRVVAIPSQHEGMPNAVLEGLASDRPVVLTNNHSIDFELPASVTAEVDADDHAAIRDQVLRFWRAPPPAGSARSVVAHLSWDAVAEKLSAIYNSLLGSAPAESARSH